ncbi:hypothetical protein SAY86_008516 [Trapa natans]|uniref:Galectin domain-containing protein n=1 Tax=Trapa natans TaxID=22666 RepID=A0AAN7K6H6_TRANT|nr:hypothetical protein SAY86_008516 [Trapa natans]
MKKWYGIIIVASLFMLLVVRYVLLIDQDGRSYLRAPVSLNGTNPLEWVKSTAPQTADTTAHASPVIPVEAMTAILFTARDLGEEQQSLSTWNHLKELVNHAQLLPNGLEAIKEAGNAWKILMDSVEEQRHSLADNSSRRKENEKQCPHFLNKVNVSVLDNNDFKLRVPCGLTQGSAITVIGTPDGILGNFRIDLAGEPLPGEPDPPIILHYNVRLHGDKLTENPVIVQNTWTAAHDWGEEERCPSPTPDKNKKVDELEQCNPMVGKDDNHSRNTRTRSNSSKLTPTGQDGSATRKYFPFKQGYPSVSTIRVGSEGIQMTVDGKHISSFAYRETLEPWLVSEVKISGDLKLMSVLASGLPASEDSDHSVDLEALKAVRISHSRLLDLFIGVFSTANNFKRRMAVRRTWMQYPAVRSGAVAVRFFVGLHKNQIVNEELWNEAQTYGDVQLMPFVDYYNLITWKTLAICIFGTKVVPAKYVMKTDDDAFVRIDEVLASLSSINVNTGLLYGLIESDSKPHRNPESKWYISPEEWKDDTYPPWAHGPGYVVSSDIANAVYKRYNQGKLKMFKLEDVSMGIWISDLKKEHGLNVKYQNDDRIFNTGCKDQYIIAHYQGPREMLCLWQKLQESKRAICCGER